MPDSIHLMLSHLERDYYDGVGTDRLHERVLAIVEQTLETDTNHALRALFEQNAPELWGASGPSAPVPDEVDAALGGPNGAEYLRAWANFGKTVAINRDVA